MNRTVEEYIQKQTEKARLAKQKEKEVFLEDIELYERVYSENTEYTDEFPCRDVDEESENYQKYYKNVKLDLTDEEYEEVVKAYRLNNPEDAKSDTIATILQCLAIFIYFVGGILALFVASADVFTGIASIFSVFVSGTLILGFSRVINLLNDIKNK